MIRQDQPTIFDTKKVTVAVSAIEDGNIKRECSDDAIANIERFVHGAGLDANYVAAMYVNDPHAWDVIHIVRSEEAVYQQLEPDSRIHADALITDIPGIALLLPIADCIPVVLHDPLHQVLALVHLGWQSTEARLAQKVIEKMRELYGSNPEDIRAYFGPSIKAESYVFSDRPMQADDPEWAAFLHKEPDGTGIDLPGFNREQFILVGLTPEHIQISPINTATSKNYFSHYRTARSEGREVEGRFAVVCGLKESRQK